MRRGAALLAAALSALVVAVALVFGIALEAVADGRSPYHQAPEATPTPTVSAWPSDVPIR